MLRHGRGRLGYRVRPAPHHRGVALVVAVWLVLTRVFVSTRAGRHAAHFLDVGGADMPPEQRIKYKNQHPGAGGNG